MALSGRRVGFIVLLMVAALSGLVWLQVALLSYAMKIKEQTFRNSVLTALAQTSRSLAEGEVMSLAIDTTMSTPSTTLQVMAVVSGDERNARIWQSHDSSAGPGGEMPAPIRFEDGRVTYTVDRPQHVAVSVFTADHHLDSVLVDRFHEQGEYELPFQPAGDVPGPLLWRVQVDDQTQVMRWESMQHDTLILLPDSGKRQFASAVMSRLLAAEQTPLLARLDSIDVDSILGSTLRASGIDMKYAYGIFTLPGDSLASSEPPGFELPLKSSDLRVRLFPQDVFAPPAFLSVHFPDRQSYLWAQLFPLVSAEVVFMLIIIACFGYTIRTILRQKRFSRLLVEFINNMTHEFKTPISTVALASEAIARPEVLEQQSKVLQFNAMIKSEIGRMRSQTEKILQMASLEEGDLALDLAPLNLHEVIRGVVEAQALQVEHHGGRIHCTLAARDVVVDADRTHLAGVISNILDNAVKYSQNAPQIEVETKDADGGVEVMVSDQGIGMSGEHARQAFDKYFRVPTGNRHDVKGFGLGLSYVKLMVEAHGGQVKLESAQGRGTTVRILLPHAGPGDPR